MIRNSHEKITLSLKVMVDERNPLWLSRLFLDRLHQLIDVLFEDDLNGYAELAYLEGALGNRPVSQISNVYWRAFYSHPYRRTRPVLEDVDHQLTRVVGDITSATPPIPWTVVFAERTSRVIQADGRLTSVNGAYSRHVRAPEHDYHTA